jgi:hypothetical protein
MNTVTSQPITVGRCAMDRFIAATKRAELVTGCRIEILDPRHRLLSIRLVLRVTGPAQMILAAGRILDREVGR